MIVSREILQIYIDMGIYALDDDNAIDAEVDKARRKLIEAGRRRLKDILVEYPDLARIYVSVILDNMYWPVFTLAFTTGHLLEYYPSTWQLPLPYKNKSYRLFRSGKEIRISPNCLPTALMLIREKE